MTSPVFAAIIDSSPSRFSLVASVRGAAVLPDDGVDDRASRARSHTTVVSRWLVMPMAAMSAS